MEGHLSSLLIRHISSLMGLTVIVYNYSILSTLRNTSDAGDIAYEKDEPRFNTSQCRTCGLDDWVKLEIFPTTWEWGSKRGMSLPGTGDQ